MSWPVVVPDGWRIDEMPSAMRSVHVRKHLLNRTERFEELTVLSAETIRAIARRFEAAGCTCGPGALKNDAPRAAEHGEALKLYHEVYQALARAALADGLSGDGELATFAHSGLPHPFFSLYVVTEAGLVVVFSGPHHHRLYWKTAYRHRGSRRRPNAARIHNHFVRSLRTAASLSQAFNKGGTR